MPEFDPRGPLLSPEQRAVFTRALEREFARAAIRHLLTQPGVMKSRRHHRLWWWHLRVKWAIARWARALASWLDGEA